MDLLQTPTQMKAAGILMRARGDRLSVASRAPLTNQQRAWVLAHKAELLRLLAGAVPDPKGLTAAEQEINAGRAVVRELDGAESRETTEGDAGSAMRIYRYSLVDKPDAWLTMIAPDCDLDEARRNLRLRFGKRLTDVVEHPRGV